MSGLGVVSSEGLGVDALAQCFFSSDPLAGQNTCRGASFQAVPEFDISDLVGSAALCPNGGAKYALAAASLALKNGGLEGDVIDPFRSGLATATALGSAAGRGRMPAGPPALSATSVADAGNSLISNGFALHGYNQHFCGDMLSGARAVAAAFTALRSGQAAMMLAGGTEAFSDGLQGWSAAGEAGRAPLVPAEGAAFLMLESESSLDSRDGSPYCELGAVVCVGIGGEPRVGRKRLKALEDALKKAVELSLAEANIWEGDVGVVFVCAAPRTCRAAVKAQCAVLAEFGHVPATSVHQHIGDTCAASFPMECAAAALVLNEDALPAGLTFRGIKDGVEFWMEEPQQLLGDAALVIGCAENIAAAAVMLSC